MDVQDGITAIFLDATGAKTVKARIAPGVTVKRILPNIVSKMSLPAVAPDGTPMVYVLDCKELGIRMREDQTLAGAGVKEGSHFVVVPEIVAG
jgi:WXG100 protein secretion system (Wss), protein YukD